MKIRCSVSLSCILFISQLHAGLERGSPQYEALKEERSQVLWRAVERVIPDIRQRIEIQMVRDRVVQSYCKPSN